jgi:NAD(P)-dependent dehydrogenase (short-subunit alcohol dehydrogenase family)
VPPSDQQRPKSELPEQLLLLSPYQEGAWFEPLRKAFASAADALPFFHADPKQKDKDLFQQLAESGKRTLIVDLLACTQQSDETNTPELTIKRTQQRLKIAKALVHNRDKLQWLALIPKELLQTERAALAGATTGSLKSLGHEWGIWTRSVIASLEDLPADWLIDEISDSALYPEIRYQQRARQAPHLRMARETTPLSLPEQPVFLATGGAGGITQTILKSIRQQHGPIRVVVLGRTSLPSEADEMALREPSTARKKLKESMEPDTPPKALQEAFRAAQKRARLKLSLDELRAAGLDVSYEQADVQVQKDVQRAVTRTIEKWGQIDVVIHGAGIDQSRDITQKSKEEVGRVLGVKLLGLQHLKHALADQPVKAWFGTSSVSARFGNTGQFDYAAANDAMAHWLQSDPSFAHSLIIDYTAWDDVGMAASLASLMKERGVDMLPSKQAAHSTAQMLLGGHTGEWVCAGRLPRPFSEDPQLGQLQVFIPSAHIEFQQTLQTKQQRYLSDHTILDAEVVPGVVSITNLKRAIKHLLWGHNPRSFENIHLGKAIKVWDKRDTTIRLAVSHTPREQALAIITSQAKRGREHVTQTHVSLTYQQDQCDPPDATLALAQRVPQLKQAPLAHAEIYELFFHGPAWQVLDQVMLSDDFAFASTPALVAPLGEGLEETERWTAVGLEALFQTAGMWSAKQEKVMALPYGIKQLLLLQEIQPGQVYDAKVMAKGRIDDVLQFDAVLLAPDQTPAIWMQDLELRIFPMPSM